jgi:hypothetical protein
MSSISTHARAGKRFFQLLSAVTVAALVAENALRFPLSVPWMTELSGGLRILDMRPFYSPGQVYQLFEALGVAGRSAYLRLLWSVDAFLPLLFSLFLSEAVARGALRRYRLVPFAAGLADYLENMVLTALLLRYPARLDALARVASVLTSLKHGLYLAGLILAALGAARELLGRGAPPAVAPNRGVE